MWKAVFQGILGLGGLSAGPKKPGSKTTEAQKKKKSTEDGDEDEDDPIIKAEKEFHAIIKKVSLSSVEVCNGQEEERRKEAKKGPVERCTDLEEMESRRK